MVCVMAFEFSNFSSGLLGALIGSLSSFVVAWFQTRWNREDNVKRMNHECDLLAGKIRHEVDHQARQMTHDKSLQSGKILHENNLLAEKTRQDHDMQRREGNYKKTGFYEMPGS